jgi:triacylglycerol lipase
MRRLVRYLARLILPLCLLFSGPAAADPAAYPPIVFVHGNGDTDLPRVTTIWRFESNGWPRDRLHTFNMPYPLARDDDAIPQAERSSSTEQARVLADEVQRALQASGAKKVVLVGNSRGGNAIRTFIVNGGDRFVSHVVLGGAPNHGVWHHWFFRSGSEFNGAKGTSTRVDYDGPALKGATNLVLPARDHRELSFHPEAFAQTHAFITGRPPARLDIAAEEDVTLNGQVLALQPATNRPLSGAVVEIYAVDRTTALRQGAALTRKVVGPDGQWGPLRTDSRTALEIVVDAPGFGIVHFYRNPHPRSSDSLHLRIDRLTDTDREAKAVLYLIRPRGYFGLPRDTISFDGQPAPGIPNGVAAVGYSKLQLGEDLDRPIVAEFRSGSLYEKLVGRPWPAAQNHLTVLELWN